MTGHNFYPFLVTFIAGCSDHTVAPLPPGPATQHNNVSLSLDKRSTFCPDLRIGPCTHVCTKHDLMIALATFFVVLFAADTVCYSTTRPCTASVAF